MSKGNRQIVIVGGGLAGLTAAIHLSKAQFQVTLIEKETYPKHKVCGEYISNEVLPYLSSLDLDMDTIGAVSISKLKMSTQQGAMIQCDLPLGGFGISRYSLDNYLYKKAIEFGVTVFHAEVTAVVFKNELFKVTTQEGEQIVADFVIGAYGKRAGLDTTLDRNFNKNGASWLGVKAHYSATIPRNTVQLHNFRGGYCGISEIEKNKVNVCYLVHYDSFKKQRSLQKFQELVLNQNPHLKLFFEQASLIFDKPLTIAQINFATKKSVENHMLMCGDAAGLIHPLCGNGMAMAIAGAQLVSDSLIAYAKNKMATRKVLEDNYESQWQAHFGSRLYTGRLLQKVILNANMQMAAQKIAGVVPNLIPRIVRKTHGKLLKPARF